MSVQGDERTKRLMDKETRRKWDERMRRRDEEGTIGRSDEVIKERADKQHVGDIRGGRETRGARDEGGVRQ